jgi:UDP-2,3-diacylglucosamine hydrolase
MASGDPIGLIAGSGRMPFLVAEGMRRAGRRVVVMGFRGSADPELRDLADEFVGVGLVRLGGWIRTMKRRNITEAIMIGGVNKRHMYTPMRLLSYLPDLRTMKLWFKRAKGDRRDAALLKLAADELASEGIELVSSVKYCPEQLADEGLMTRRAVPTSSQEDVAFGWRIARESARLDIGQSLAIREAEIIAVEAIEGTDAMIRRAGRLCRTGGWTMIKVARPNQDMRFDVPAIGPKTLRNLKDARCTCLVIEAGKTLIVDKPQTLALADELKIAIIGKRADAADGADEAGS